jgi:type III secretory pathway component EscR
MEDTLRYFFSAVFQGIAAIIALGSMFFIYYLDKIENQKMKIRNYLTGKFHTSSLEGNKTFINKGIIEYTKQHIVNYKNDKKNVIFENQLEEYKHLRRKEKIRDQIPSFLKLAISILVISLISLFLVGYYCYLNFFLIFVGVIVIIMTFIYLRQLLKLIIQILDL